MYILNSIHVKNFVDWQKIVWEILARRFFEDPFNHKLNKDLVGGAMIYY